jgi:hypothetical protein
MTFWWFDLQLYMQRILHTMDHGWNRKIEQVEDSLAVQHCVGGSDVDQEIV